VADVECSGQLHYLHKRFLEIPRIHRLTHGYRKIFPWHTERSQSVHEPAKDRQGPAREIPVRGVSGIV
jgi:hypothetical protein